MLLICIAYLREVFGSARFQTAGKIFTEYLVWCQIPEVKYQNEQKNVWEVLTVVFLCSLSKTKVQSIIKYHAVKLKTKN